MSDLLCGFVDGREIYNEPARVCPIDAPRPTGEPPPGATHAGQPEVCDDCGAIEMPYSVVVDDILGGSIDPARRVPLCLACTVATVARFDEAGIPVSADLAWARRRS